MFSRRIAVALQFVVILAATTAHAATPLQYSLKFGRPNTHLMDVSIRADGLQGTTAQFAMPDWAPGSYFVMNYAAEVQDFSARGPAGQPLSWHKTDGQTWSVDLHGAGSVTVDYKIYGNTLQNNMAQYNDQHAFIGGPAVWMYLAGGKERPIELSIEPPNGWSIATGMERAGNTFRAADYDWFADSPIEISAFQEQTFEVSDTTYHVIVHDVEGHKDFSKFAADAKKIVQTLVPIFAPVTGTPQPAPFRTYWFLFHVWPKTGGGLEHLNSTQINFSKDWDDLSISPFSGRSEYQGKLFVTAHEFFHAWNVKRLRPRPLGPFDYSREVHTPSLWISEGLTSYYGSLALVRAGLLTPQQYLDAIGKLITRFEQQPGRSERSIEDTSWDTWLRPLKIENNLANTWYSYYDGGQIAGHLLDFAIRQNTRNQKSLDDWMRLLYSRYALPKPGFLPQDAVRAASEIAGLDMSTFFARYLSGKEALPYETYFAYAGISVQKKAQTEKPWLGLELEKGDDGKTKISSVTPGSPAEQAGLSQGDVILAADGRSASDEESFKKIVEGRKPGDNMKIAVLRDEQIREFAARLTPNPYFEYTLEPVQHPSELQKEIYSSWLGLGNDARN